MTKKLSDVAAWAALALSLASSLPARAAEPPAPRFYVPMSAKAPIIDGRIDPNEWAGALAFCGTLDGTGKLFAIPTTFHVTYDRDRLYWAARSVLPDGRKPSGGGVSENTWMKFSESLWLHVFPDIDGPVGKRAWYWLLANCDGIKLDTRFGVDGGRVQEMWEGRWTIRRRAEPGLWEIEVSAPIDDFADKPLADGDVWGMNFSFRWAVPYKVVQVSPDAEMGESANFERFCRMTFDSRAAAFQLASLGDVARGRLDLRAAARAADKREIAVTAVLSAPADANKPSGPVAQVWRGERKLTADKVAGDLTWAEDLPIAGRGNVLTVPIPRHDYRQLLLTTPPNP